MARGKANRFIGCLFLLFFGAILYVLLAYPEQVTEFGKWVVKNTTW